MRNDAKAIAAIISGTDIEERGNLLAMIAEELQGNMQHFTANIIHSAALAYGIKEKDDE